MMARIIEAAERDPVESDAALDARFDATAASLARAAVDVATATGAKALVAFTQTGDRKSTRLNSSHANISYAVFCLKKKKSMNYLGSYQLITRTMFCLLERFSSRRRPQDQLAKAPVTIPSTSRSTMLYSHCEYTVLH